MSFFAFFQHVTKESVKSNGDGLSALFTGVLEFVDGGSCAHVMHASVGEGVRGFDLLVTVVFPEVPCIVSAFMC